MLFPALIAEYYQQKKESGAPIDRSAFALALIPLGVSSYLLLNWILLGSPLEFTRVHVDFWHQFLAPAWVGMINMIQSWSWRPPRDIVFIVVYEVAAGLTGYAFALFALKKLRLSYGIYALLSILLITMSNFWLSLPRYLLTIFPIFLILAKYVKRPIVQYTVLIGGMFCYVIGLMLFVRGWWAL